MAVQSTPAGQMTGQARSWVSTAPLEVLTDREPADLLSSRCVGRLAFGFESCSVILRVDDTFDYPGIVLRTAAGAQLDSTPMHAVAFEIDGMDPAGQ